MNDVTPAQEVIPPSEALKAARKALAGFIDLNPSASIEEIDRGDGSSVLSIQKPWGDSSLAIVLDEDLDQLAETLNKLRLPDRYSAIWHADNKSWEIIWTAHRVSKASGEVVGRKFTFKHFSLDYECEFGKSSDRLLKLAEKSQFVGPSQTDYRNLASFAQYVFVSKQKADGDELMPWVAEPLSFWIRNVDWDEDSVLDLANHINFYMTYYDSACPTILIHFPRSVTTVPKTRYTTGAFPSVITSKSLDDNLLVIWNAARTGDAARKFQLYYRIVEYCSSFYLENSVKVAVRKLLSAPHALDNTDLVTERVLNEVGKTKLDEYKRFEHIITETVTPDLLSREMNENPDAFIKETIFDGNFRLKATLSDGKIPIEFKQSCFVGFAGALRDIRNGLSHGKEVRSAGAINPTVRNFQLLQPWVSVISVVAGEVMLYRHLP